MTTPVLILHGGAGTGGTQRKRLAKIRRKIGQFLTEAYEVLAATDALGAVVHAVCLLENDPEFNAGRGSMLQADGQARLSASVMDGAQQRFAGVVNLEKIRNPVLVAQALLQEESRVLAGPGAYRFARRIGLKAEDLRTPNVRRIWRKRKQNGCDTVGACALDRHGNLASATSTGGRGFEYPGRVSDSAMPVANYADAFCAISASGHGEEIIDEGLAVRIATRRLSGHPLREAFDWTFRQVRLRKRRIGAVGVDRRGHIAHATTTKVLLYGWRRNAKQKLF